MVNHVSISLLYSVTVKITIQTIWKHSKTLKVSAPSLLALPCQCGVICIHVQYMPQKMFCQPLADSRNVKLKQFCLHLEQRHYDIVNQSILFYFLSLLYIVFCGSFGPLTRCVPNKVWIEKNILYMTFVIDRGEILHSWLCNLPLATTGNNCLLCTR